jgi:RNA polymerase sigma factor (sigma-70 family)
MELQKKGENRDSEIESLTSRKKDGTLYQRREAVAYEIKQVLRLELDNLIDWIPKVPKFAAILKPETLVYLCRAFRRHFGHTPQVTKAVNTIFIHLDKLSREVIDFLIHSPYLKEHKEDISQSVALELHHRLLNPAPHLLDYAEVWFIDYVKKIAIDEIRNLNKYPKHMLPISDESYDIEKKYTAPPFVTRPDFDSQIDLMKLLDRLDLKEAEVAMLILEGLRQQEIAAALHVQPRTVRYRIEKIRRKLKEMSPPKKGGLREKK